MKKKKTLRAILFGIADFKKGISKLRGKVLREKGGGEIYESDSDGDDSREKNGREIGEKRIVVLKE